MFYGTQVEYMRRLKYSLNTRCLLYIIVLYNDIMHSYIRQYLFSSTDAFHVVGPLIEALLAATSSATSDYCIPIVIHVLWSCGPEFFKPRKLHLTFKVPERAANGPIMIGLPTGKIRHTQSRHGYPWHW